MNSTENQIASKIETFDTALEGFEKQVKVEVKNAKAAL